MRISDWSSDVCASDLVSSHDALLEMLKDNRFSTNYKHWEFAPPPKPVEQQNHFERAIDAGLFAVDPKEHLRLRKLTMPAFSKPVMGKSDAKIRDLVVTCFYAIGTPDELDAFPMIPEKLPLPIARK